MAPYKQFQQWIIKHGQTFPKKHGEWKVVKVLDKWFVMDTWNKQIIMSDTKPSPGGRDVWNNVVGFYGITNATRLAIDFGRFEVTEPRLLSYYYYHAHPVWIKREE